MIKDSNVNNVFLFILDLPLLISSLSYGKRISTEDHILLLLFEMPSPPPLGYATGKEDYERGKEGSHFACTVPKIRFLYSQK
jgi:hypothetical protein